METPQLLLVSAEYIGISDFRLDSYPRMSAFISGDYYGFFSPLSTPFIQFVFLGTSSLESGLSEMVVDTREGSRFMISKSLWDFLEEKHGAGVSTKETNAAGVIRQ